MDGLEEQFGVPHAIGAPVTLTRFPEQAIVCMPPNTAKFTIKEWYLNNNMRCRNSEDQQQLAERILTESQRMRDETKERSENAKQTTDRRIEERIVDVKFNKNELELARIELINELDSLKMYKERLQDCLASLETNALTICNKCLMMRDARLGIDLVVDDIDEALRREITTILGGQCVLRKSLEQLNEQMRRIRATRYMIDRDLLYKGQAIDIDEGNLSLKPTSLYLSVYEGYENMDPSGISAEEYVSYSTEIITKACQEVNSARPIRYSIDILIKQVINDLKNAHDFCNHQFAERIKNTKLAKAKLEDMHYKTSEQIVAMQKNILELQIALVEKEGYVGLAHTRLGRRVQRQEGELVRDPGAQALLYECEYLRYSVEQLQQMLHEANASLRYLLQTQLQLEEDINIKMNTLKIDEIDCLTLRATMEYHEY